MATISRGLISKSFTLMRANALMQMNTSLKQPFTPMLRPHFRSISTSQTCACVSQELATSEEDEVEVQQEPGEFEHRYVTNFNGTGRITAKKVDVETSIRYMESPAYERTYGDKPVWKPYRRNYRGKEPSKRTRNNCLRGVWLMSNPCAICRDEYLVVDKTNVKLLEQFRDPITGDILPAHKTGVCQKQHKKLRTAVMQAYDTGMLLMPVPFRRFNYATYYKNLPEKTKMEKPVEVLEKVTTVIPNFALHPTNSLLRKKERFGKTVTGESVDSSWSPEDLRKLEEATLQQSQAQSVNEAVEKND